MDLETGRKEVYVHDEARRLQSLRRTNVVNQQENELLTRFWKLDSVGNWQSLHNGLADTDTVIESRDHNALHEVTNRQVGSFGAVDHDDRGRLTLDGEGLEFVWDGRDRLIEVRTVGAGLIEAYRYDALGRRVRRDRPNPLSGEPDFQTGATLFAYAGMRCVEERTCNYGVSEAESGDPRDPGVGLTTTSVG